VRDRLIAARSTNLCAAYRSIGSAALSTDCTNHSNACNIYISKIWYGYL